jgi:hypothetical protein
MKNIKLLIVIILLTITSITLGVLYFSQKYETKEIVTNLETVDESDYLYSNEYFESLPKEELTQEEIDGLLLMREEEKFAHDVYTKLYEIWGENIFLNISDSEQTHTDMVKDLLVKYELTDPADREAIGDFTNTDLATLYTQLTEQGSNSLVDALVVGATVEDLDIKDLEDLMAQTDNEDILAVYQNLQKGSRNHLRSFTRVLNRNGETYTPQYITQIEYDEIIGTPSENGITYDSKGEEI